MGILIAARGPRAASDAAEPLLVRASGAALVWTCLAGAYSFGRTGQIEKALHASDIGYAAHRELAEPTDWYPWFHQLTRCMSLAQAGRLVEAEELALAQPSRGVADSSPEAQAFFSWHLVKVVGERGHVHDAVHHGREAVALLGRLGRPQYARECQIALAHALALANRGTEAADRLAELSADVEGELAPARVLLAARCPGAATPVLRRLEVHASLTRAEYEVALLAAGRNSSKAIADKLQLSVRTVQIHLQHTYDKLGIHNRGQLPDVMDGVRSDEVEFQG